MKSPPANVLTETETYGVKKITYTFSKSEILACLIKKHNIPLYRDETTHSFNIMEAYEEEPAKAVLTVNYKQKEGKDVQD